MNDDDDKPIDWAAWALGMNRAQRRLVHREKRRKGPGRPTEPPVTRPQMKDAYRAWVAGQGYRSSQEDFTEFLGALLKRPDLSLSTVKEWRTKLGLPWPIE